MAAKGEVVASFERDWSDGSRFVVQTMDYPGGRWRDVNSTNHQAVAVVRAWVLVHNGVYEARVLDTEAGEGDA